MTGVRTRARMTGTEYVRIITKLGMTQVSAGHFLKCTERTSRRYAADGPSDRVGDLLAQLDKDGATLQTCIDMCMKEGREDIAQYLREAPRGPGRPWPAKEEHANV